MKIGFSFGRCIRDIVKGDVDINDVVAIITRTRMTEPEDMKFVIAEYMYVPHYLMDLDEEKCQEVGLELWTTGRLHQPRNFGTRPVRIIEDHVWMDLVPTKLSDHEGVKEAWEQYRIMLKLSDIVPDKPERL
jgi:hypothetical protein